MTLLITPELRAAVWKIFVRWEKQGCAAPWNSEATEEAKADECEASQLDTCAVLVDHGVTVADLTMAYGALMALECVRYRRWPSNHEILDAINSRRPDATETAVKAEATRIFERIVGEIEAGRHRDLAPRVRATFGLAATEALAAVGGQERLNSGADYMGAIWHAFVDAYVQAVAGGRDRGDALKALPPPKPLELTGSAEATQEDGLRRISGRLEDLLSPDIGKTLRPDALRVVAPVDPEVRLAQLRRQAAELLSQEEAS